MTTDNQNPVFTLAADLVNQTNQSIFLTGKAGTGKTTFLRHIKATTIKNTVVVAPTGVAAINAGGVTMHSFFQLPFSPYIPQSTSMYGDSGSNVINKHTLFRNIKFNNDKRKLLQELQLLIIDEVSMVRADMLDAMDTILREFRNKRHLPFGGVQVLFIGDMYQLPPVVPDSEWRLLEAYYDSPFFFSANVFNNAPPLYVELKKIYRQKDQQFIDILNRVRNNHTTADDLAILNELYKPTLDYTTSKSILLTTHNYKADAVNKQELGKLTSPSYTFKGEIEGDFNDKLLPNDLSLELKVGAQIMFIKNDSTVDKKYFNGKLATIKKIEVDKINVQFNDNEELYELKKEVWKNIRYSLNSNNEIEEQELGSYTQYPIRLAWAVTIHKSQGLTFENVTIDAGQSFAAGQVYVALSRCTNMQGIILHSIIPRSAINTDERIIAFAKQEAQYDELESVLIIEKEIYWAGVLQQLFQFEALQKTAATFTELVKDKALPNKEAVVQLAQTIEETTQQLQTVANKFLIEINNILANKPVDKALLLSRTQKALDYFSGEIINKILQPFYSHIQNLAQASKVRQYVKAAKAIGIEFYMSLQKLNNAVYDGHKFTTNLYTLQDATPVKKEKLAKEDNVPSAEFTAVMYNHGKTIDEIAVERNLAISTIEGHLAQMVRKGRIAITQLVNEADLALIQQAIVTDGGHSITPIKALLPEHITYNQIRAVLNHLDWEAAKTAVQ